MQRRDWVDGSPWDEVCASSILLYLIPRIVTGAINRWAGDPHCPGEMPPLRCHCHPDEAGGGRP
jgi:hypothetical protein